MFLNFKANWIKSKLMAKTFLPSQHQKELDLSTLIVPKPPDDENTVPVDVLFVGAGPSGLAGAIRLAQLVRKDPELKGLEIAVVEKAEAPGEHNLSGAVINPMGFFKLFPELKPEDFPFRTQVKKEKMFFLTKNKAFPVPKPPTMNNKGFYTASLSECVRFLCKKAEDLGIHLLMNSPVESLLVEGQAVKGVKTTESGLDRKGERTQKFMPSTCITSQVTVLSEGTRGLLSQAYQKWQNISSFCPQIYALGVKEIWEIPTPLPYVLHTVGYPLSTQSFGGSFFYPLGDNKVSLGLVAGLDDKNGSHDVHLMLQDMKEHPFFQKYLKGGKVLEWGAKTIPEGGYQSLPERFSGEGLLMVGDCVGFVNVPSLKGIHYSMMSGIEASETLLEAFRKNDFSASMLKNYDERIKKSFIVKDLYKVRNLKPSFKKGLFLGVLKAGLFFLTGGRFFKSMSFESDSHVKREICLDTKTKLPEKGLSKVDAVYLSSNKTRDDIPSHLIVGKDISSEVAEFYTRLCPAGVYERQGETLIVNSPNCIDCKATDVLGPRWKPREGGSGPHYKEM